MCVCACVDNFDDDGSNSSTTSDEIQCPQDTDGDQSIDTDQHFQSVGRGYRDRSRGGQNSGRGQSRGSRGQSRG